jgi:condensin complex subunit 2
MKEFSEKIVQLVPDYNSRQEDTLNDIGYEQIGGFDDDDHGDELEFPITLTLPDQEPLDYGALLSQQPKPSTSEPLVFSKKAKRVDVQKLKENLWSKLAENSFEKPKAVDMDDDKTIFEEEIHCEKTFTKVIKELDSCYEEKPRKDISVAFCFICVLHLANENNLFIQGSESMKELIIRN